MVSPLVILADDIGVGGMIGLRRVFVSVSDVGVCGVVGLRKVFVSVSNSPTRTVRSRTIFMRFAMVSA